MKLFATVLALLTFVAAGNAQISTFPYTYDWTSPASFLYQNDGHTYLSGGDGNWGCYRVASSPSYVTVSSGGGYVQTNVKFALDTMFVTVDARGRSFTGAEVVTFSASRTGNANDAGTLYVVAGGSVITTIDIPSQLTATMQNFSGVLPTGLSNSVFSLLFVASTNNNGVAIDNTSIHGGALPITLSSFKLDMTAESPELTWSTLSEINNYGFYVQKSQDNATWVDIAGSFQPGYGTTVDAHFYSFTDNTLPAGPYYRLRQVDLDGTNHYSDVLSVATGIEPTTVVKEFALSQNYPNPFNPKTGVRFQVPGVSKAGIGSRESGVGVKLSVYDLLGREVAVLVNEPKAPGSYEVSFDGSGLASGVYIYRLTAGSFVSTKKMVLMK